MSETGLKNFDHTLQKTNAWLNAVGELTGVDRQHQFHALRAVLWALRDRLTTEEAFHLSAHMPLLVRGIYWEDYRPAGKPDTYKTRDDFLQKVTDALAIAAPMNPEDATRAVLTVIAAQLPEGELEHVTHMLPSDVQTLFPDR
ncbi:DUF2267 domain-containing protein [Loktanella sp. SALINAS62]|uniref:DUF2267 domain-containing protein n=1 Tax=Loktanella sp. SALINAS62 TaxID=2706124 RepID=UPI001B8AE68D|nr:DUF2267 domain-containing protein [Loktanella sp. SALINAS62]MBS1303309.1 DUF2267 domain-containing protein [Loktanella sp. SALINAS62]